MSKDSSTSYLKEIFLSVDKDDDCKITLKQLSKVIMKLYGINYDADKQYSSLIGLIKIDFWAFLAFHEKYKLRRLLNIDGKPDMETKKEIWKIVDLNGDGVMSKFEFKHWTKKLMEIDSEAESDDEDRIESAEMDKVLEHAFKELDRDGDGVVTFKEMDETVDPK